MASAESPACVEAPHPYSSSTANDSAEHVQRSAKLAERPDSSRDDTDNESFLYHADDESSRCHTDDSDEGYCTDDKSKTKGKDKDKDNRKSKRKRKRKRRGEGKGKEKEKELPSHMDAVAWKLNTSSHEALLGLNKRVRATRKEVGLGGDKRAFVKLIVKFNDGSTGYGSGVLVSESIVATAGHILLNNEGNGHAKSVVILAGVHGKERKGVRRRGIYARVHSKERVVERRHGIYAVVPYGWFADSSNANDVGLIHLNKAFNTVRPIKVKQTPANADVNASVYGLPYDKPYYCHHLVYSKAVIWYEHFLTKGIVEHTGETVRGCSGGAVVDENGFLVAIHSGYDTRGNGEVFNQAVAINREGNDFAPLVAILEHIHGHRHGVSEVHLFANEGDNIEVKKIGRVKLVGGFAYSW